jgi:3-oxoacyl-[acyl-carrier protein] reductase
MNDLTGRRVALVTGASRGIGAAIARRLAGDGLAVAAVARSRASLESLAQELGDAGGRVEPIAADLADPTAADRVAREVLERFGRLDVLVHNAGVGGPYQRAHEIDPATWRNVFAVNVDALMHLCRVAIPAMRAARFGRIVAIGSIYAFRAGEGSAAYVASKHAVVGYVRSLAVELGRDGITANAVCPGFTDTDMLASLGPEQITRLREATPLKRLASPDEIAALVALLAGDGGGYLSGAAIPLDGGFLAGPGLPALPAR